MSKKHLVWASIVASITAALFRLGGSDHAPKAVRRYGIPLVVLVLLLHTGIDWISSLLVVGGLAGSLSLGYGEDKPYFIKFLIGVSFITPSVFLGYTHLQWLTPSAFTLMFYLSNNKKTERIFVWPLVETLTGALIGLTYYFAIYG